jgi:4-amino-4-deoxy-L-arabinose transferase-like glycosyltransferase
MRPLERRDVLLLVAIGLFGLWRLAPGLGHSRLHNWDEAVHMAAARGTFATPLAPHIVAAPLDPIDPHAWWVAPVWLHKPTLPFWLSALSMHVIGVVPLAVRLWSLLAELACAGVIFLLGRELIGRAFATAGALVFLALPFGWRLTQGEMFGDVTDCVLAAFVALSVWLLVRACARDSWKLALLAGASCGAAYLSKTGLGLVPLGIALVLAGWRALGGGGLSWRGAAGFVIATAAIAMPWNLYTAHHWPEVYRVEAEATRAHLFASKADIGPWLRPADAIFNEINDTEFGPVPVALTLIAGVWLAIRALRSVRWRRAAPPSAEELVAIASALWLWASWIGLSLARAKVPACTWEAAPVVVLALAVLIADALTRPVLAAMTVGATLGTILVAHVHALAAPRMWLPAAFTQTRERPASVGALVVALGAGLIVLGLGRALRNGWLTRVTASAALAAALWLFGWKVPEAQAHESAQHPDAWDSYTEEAGHALSAIPSATVFALFDHDSGDAFPLHELMFWSGHDAHGGTTLLSRAIARGDHPFAVSTIALPFEPVAGVPAYAWSRAYDLARPQPKVGLPDGVHPLAASAGNLEVLGVACGTISRGHGRMAVYARAHGPASELTVGMQTEEGDRPVRVPLSATLRSVSDLQKGPWFIVPVRAPSCDSVRRLTIGGQSLANPFSQGR